MYSCDVCNFVISKCRGFSDPIFGLAVVYAGLIMYDAQVWYSSVKYGAFLLVFDVIYFPLFICITWMSFVMFFLTVLDLNCA